MGVVVREPVTPAALAFVLQNLWPRGVEEMNRLGLNTLQAFARFMAYAEMPDADAAILSVDGEPIVAVGIASEGEERFTWFIATSQFDAHGKAITKFIRRYVREHEGALCIYSVCVHPDTEKWFRLLGFVRSAWVSETREGWPLYRFEKEMPCVVAAAAQQTA